MKSYDSSTKEYKYLKKNWKLFLKNRYDLSKITYEDKRNGIINYIEDDVDIVLRAYPELFEIYWSKEEFQNYMVKLHEYEETKNKMNFFINKFSKSSLKELQNISQSFTNWYQEIINAYAKNATGFVLTNTIAESNNNYIQTLINIGYGYSNFNRLRKRILYVSSN